MNLRIFIAAEVTILQLDSDLIRSPSNVRKHELAIGASRVILNKSIRTMVVVTTAAYATGLCAEQPSSEPQGSAQPVFLLSERELGSGVKVCFLSNGLQIRQPSDKVCPYPLKARPFALEPQSDLPMTTPTKASPSADGGKTTFRDASTLVEKPITQRSTTQAATANAAVKLPETTKPSPSNQQLMSQPVVQPITSTQPNTASSNRQASVESNGNEHRRVIEDEIADKAISRCERIGYKLGTEQFKVCALDQIKILSGLRP